MTQQLVIRQFIVVLALIVGVSVFSVGAEDSGGDTVSFEFKSPIPVNIRKSDNSLYQMMLVSMSETSITVLANTGKTFEYQNKSVRTVRSPDGSFFYTPSKDNPADFINRLNKAQMGTLKRNGVAEGAGQPAAGNQGAVNPGGGGTVPPPRFAPDLGHAQPTTPQPATGQPATSSFGPTNNSAAETAQQAAAAHAHAQQQAFGSMPASSPMPATTPTPAAAHTPVHMPASMPTGSFPSPNSGMHNTPGTQMVYEYQCEKCHHKFTSATEIAAGGRCPKCGVVWGYVKDGNTGRIVSGSSVGVGVGGVAFVIWLVVTLVRRLSDD